MVIVTVSETYDLSTVKDKMTLIGVHTPTKELIQKTYPGLCMNSKYCRILKTDVVLSAVSGTVAITPDMVGDNSADGIAPEDVLNPILYKAVSNDSWSTLEARLNGMFLQPSFNDVYGTHAMIDSDDVTGLADEFGVYYSLLSNRDGFRMAPIQQGLEMRGLVPMVFEKWYNMGENQTSIGDSANVLREVIDGGTHSIEVGTYGARAMRGRPHPMPKFNTTYLTGATGADPEAMHTNWENNGMSGASNPGKPTNCQIQMPDIPPVMLCAILMPPCRKTKLFFRMRVRTYLEFTEVRPIQEITSFAQMSSVYAPLVYHSDYNQQSSKMDNVTDMVDTKNAEIEKIMEGR